MNWHCTWMRDSKSSAHVRTYDQNKSQNFLVCKSDYREPYEMHRLCWNRSGFEYANISLGGDLSPTYPSKTMIFSQFFCTKLFIFSPRLIFFLYPKANRTWVRVKALRCFYANLCHLGLISCLSKMYSGVLVCAIVLFDSAAHKTLLQKPWNRSQG